ncbi:MAG: hypothetical protein EXR72_17675 [Myxococcales bacterium]|nr:hypothetical protein [Myxococcales bacterium]
MSLALETVIDGKYRIIRTLGEGGVGVVYVAEHKFLKKQFALKVLRAEMAAYPEVSARFEQEARTTSLLEHDNIVRVTDFGRTSDGELYLVMELLPGRPLSDDLYHTPKVPRDRAIWIICQVLQGLEAAHAVGIIHRDLKPENVLLVSRPDLTETVKLLDFGIAKLCTESTQNLRLTQTGTVLGTPQYMAPEQARGVSDLDHRVDLHAAGVMLYEMLAGQPPYSGDNYNIVLFEILNGKPPPLTRVAREVDPTLAAIVMKSFTHERDQRFQTARELREKLEEYLESVSPKMRLHTPSPGGTPSSVAKVPPPMEMPLNLEVISLGETHLPKPAGTAEERDAKIASRQGTALELAASDGAPIELAPVDPFRPPQKDDPRAELSLEDGAPVQLARPNLGQTKMLAELPSTYEKKKEITLARAVKEPVNPQRGKSGALVGVAGAIAVAVALWLWHPWSSDLPPPPPAKITVTLEGLPENAVVSLDGVRRFINPIEAETSATSHELRIECDGFRAKILRIDLSGNQVVDAHLERLPKR